MLFLCLVLAFGQQKLEEQYLGLDDTDLYVYFPGGNGKTSVTLLYKYLSEHIIYLDSALKKHIEGKVMVSFTIDTVGNIDNIKIVKGSYSFFNIEAVRVVSSMPNWIWDKNIKRQNRKEVMKVLPITFSLK